MKKLLCIIVILSFYSCSKIEREPLCCKTSYELCFRVYFKTAPINDFLVAIECVDKIVPKPHISAQGHVSTIGWHKKVISFWSSPKLGNVRQVVIDHPVIDKDRIFELNVYRDNRTILTKKITLRTSKSDKTDKLFTSKVVVTPIDNFVKVTGDSSAFRLNL